MDLTRKPLPLRTLGKLSDDVIAFYEQLYRLGSLYSKVWVRLSMGLLHSQERKINRYELLGSFDGSRTSA